MMMRARARPGMVTNDGLGPQLGNDGPCSPVRHWFCLLLLLLLLLLCQQGYAISVHPSGTVHFTRFSRLHFEFCDAVSLSLYDMAYMAYMAIDDVYTAKPTYTMEYTNSLLPNVPIVLCTLLCLSVLPHVGMYINRRDMYIVLYM